MSLLLRCCTSETFLLLPFIGYIRLFEAILFLSFSLIVAFVLFGVFGVVTRYILKPSPSSATPSATPIASCLAKSRSKSFTFYLTPILVCVLLGIVCQKHSPAMSSYISHLLSSYDSSLPSPSTLQQGFHYYLANKRGEGGGGHSRINDNDDASGYTLSAAPSATPSVTVITGILTPTEASALASSILSRSSSFIHVSHLAFPLPFFTYGPYWGYHHYSANHNHDTKAPRTPYALNPNGVRSSKSLDYREAVELYRPEMLDNYGWLYDRVLQSLSQHVGGLPVQFLSPNTGVPGFHIIPSTALWSYPLFRFHYDETFETLLHHVIQPNAITHIDTNTCIPESRISFTLPIAIPSGGGLDYIQFDDSAQACHEPPHRRHFCYTKKRELYTNGDMVVHKGTLIHSIGEWNYTSYKDNRITLQGFGFECDGVWYVYW
jgi:hypothetical protein